MSDYAADFLRVVDGHISGLFGSCLKVLTGNFSSVGRKPVALLGADSRPDNNCLGAASLRGDDHLQRVGACRPPERVVSIEDLVEREAMGD